MLCLDSFPTSAKIYRFLAKTCFWSCLYPPQRPILWMAVLVTGIDHRPLLLASGWLLWKRWDLSRDLQRGNATLHIKLPNIATVFYFTYGPDDQAPAQIALHRRNPSIVDVDWSIISCKGLYYWPSLGACTTGMGCHVKVWLYLIWACREPCRAPIVDNRGDSTDNQSHEGQDHRRRWRQRQAWRACRTTTIGKLIWYRTILTATPL